MYTAISTPAEDDITETVDISDGPVVDRSCATKKKSMCVGKTKGKRYLQARVVRCFEINTISRDQQSNYPLSFSTRKWPTCLFLSFKLTVKPTAYVLTPFLPFMSVVTMYLVAEAQESIVLLFI